MTNLGSREQFESLFASMASYLQADVKFRNKVAQADISLGFLVPELDGDVALRFHRGEITAVPGGSEEARVAIRMNAETMMKTLSGQHDPESAYMYGSLSIVRGSEYDAEGLLIYWHDLVAAYKAVSGA